MAVELFRYIYARICTHPIKWLDGLACAETAKLLQSTILREQRLHDLAGQLDSELFGAIGSLVDQELRTETLQLRRSIAAKIRQLEGNQAVPLEDEWTPSARLGKALPTWTVSRLADWRREWTEYVAGFRFARDTFDVELSECRKRILELLHDPLLREALLLSSQRMFDAACRYQRDAPKGAEKGKKTQRQFERSFAEHLARATLSPIPRGMLTGVGLCSPGANGPGAILRRRTRVSLPLIRKWAKRISTELDLWKKVVPRDHPTWYVDGDRIRFWRQSEDSQERTLLALPDHEVLRAFLKRLAPRESTAEELIRLVTDDLEGAMTLEEVEGFYRKLCDQGLIIGYLEVPFEASDGLPPLIEWLEKYAPESSERPKLLEIRQILEELDCEAAGPDIVRYERLRSLLGVGEIQDAIVVDVACTPGFELSPELIKKIERKLSGLRLGRSPARLPFVSERGTIERPVMSIFEQAMLDRRSLGELSGAALAGKRRRLAVDAPAWGCATVRLSEDGSEPIVVGFGDAGFLPRFVGLLPAVGEEDAVEELFLSRSKLREEAYPGIELVDTLLSIHTRLANAAWFPQMHHYGLELMDAPSRRPSSALIHLRDLRLCLMADGSTRLFRIHADGQPNTEVVLVREQPLAAPPFLAVLPQAESPSIGGSDVKWMPSTWDVDRISERPPEGLWDAFLAVQRMRQRVGTSRRVQLLGFESQWLKIGFLDLENPFHCHSLVSLEHQDGALRAERSGGPKIRLQETAPFSSQAERCLELVVPFTIRG